MNEMASGVGQINAAVTRVNAEPIFLSARDNVCISFRCRRGRDRCVPL
jgi:hypothetical protein